MHSALGLQGLGHEAEFAALLVGGSAGALNVLRALLRGLPAFTLLERPAPANESA